MAEASDVAEVTAKLEHLQNSVENELVHKLGDKLSARLNDILDKKRNKRFYEELEGRFSANESLMFNISQQMQDLTNVAASLHEELKKINHRQESLEKRIRHQSLATPDSQHPKMRVLIPWDEIQEFEMK